MRIKDRPPWMVRVQNWARHIRRDVLALWLSASDKRTPWSARLVALAVSAYALSPVDLIPDFIPVLGLLDDVIIVPLGILLAIKLIPKSLMEEFRSAAVRIAPKPASRTGLLMILALWLAALAALGLWLWPR